MKAVIVLVATLLAPPVIAVDHPTSICRGTTAAGALEGACKLPSRGANFSSYSRLGSLLGRTYVHCTVATIFERAYAEMAASHPAVHFVYSETGKATGGPLKPHRTHQNGLSVDFFVPVRNRNGESKSLPFHALNRWGYDIEFDKLGRYQNLTIDFETMAAHILALQRASAAEGVGISRVIFDPELQPFLRRTTAWPEISGRVEYSTKPAWVRHDEHYHVDFAVPCRPL